MFDWISKLIEQTGYAGIALLMFVENVFPPIPSELIMPLAGFKAAQGTLSLPLVIVAGTAGSLAGAWFWYWVGHLLGRSRVQRFAARHGRWLTMSPEDLRLAYSWLDRHGNLAVLLGRFVPAIRSIISLPAGVIRMPLRSFLLLSAVGTASWTSLLVGAGFLLESRYKDVADYLNPISNAVFVGLAGWYAWRVMTFGKQPG